MFASVQFSLGWNSAAHFASSMLLEKMLANASSTKSGSIGANVQGKVGALRLLEIWVFRIYPIAKSESSPNAHIAHLWLLVSLYGFRNSTTRSSKNTKGKHAQIVSNDGTEKSKTGIAIAPMSDCCQRDIEPTQAKGVITSIASGESASRQIPS